jgi:hypothetical protein
VTLVKSLVRGSERCRICRCLATLCAQAARTASVAASNLPHGLAVQPCGEGLAIVLPNLRRADAVMFNTVRSSPARWIAGHILAHGLERITSRDITRAYSALRPPEAKDELASVTASLVTVGWLEPEPPTNAFKPVSTWAVNPAVHVTFEARQQGSGKHASKPANASMLTCKAAGAPRAPSRWPAVAEIAHGPARNVRAMLLRRVLCRNCPLRARDREIHFERKEAAR